MDLRAEGVERDVQRQADERDDVQPVVGVSVAAAVEPVAGGRSLLAGSGAMPHSCANPASERNRSGLSPAVVSSWAATSVPTS